MPIDVENRREGQRTPVSRLQLSILLFTQLVEPFTTHLISPFSPQLVRDTGITKGDETKVGYYVGIPYTVFFMTQATTVLFWSGLSDHVGRKSILLSGLFGTSVSMCSFGLSKTYWAFVISRCFNGALSGNLSVIRSMMAEITDSTNISQTFAFSSLPWSISSTLGPLIGGALARPASQHPRVFGNNHFLKAYPYLLPSLVPAIFSAIMSLIIFFFLKETVKNRIHISSIFQISRLKRTPILQSDAPSLSTDPVASVEERPLPLRALLTRRVTITAANLSILALCDLTFHVLQPVFLSTPPAFGGPGLSPTNQGLLLSVTGFVDAIFCIVVFPRSSRRFGARNVYITGTVIGLLGFAIFPILSTVVRRKSDGALVWVLAVVQTLMPAGMSLSFVAIYLYIQAASPNRASLGATNGLCQVTAGIFRAIGPAVANSLYSVSLAKGYMGGFMVYYVFMLIATFAVWLGTFLPEDF